MTWAIAFDRPGDEPDRMGLDSQSTVFASGTFPGT